MIKAAIILAAMLSAPHHTPPDIAAGAMAAAPLYGIPIEEMAGYLVSGHPGGRYSGRCGDPSTGGTCGPYRLHRMWARHCGYPDAWRHHRVLSSLIAACMLAYSRTRHYTHCDGEHDYMAHPKASHGARDGPRSRWKVSRQRRIQEQLWRWSI